MNIILKKVRIKTLFSKFEPIKVEPLELCYLKRVSEDLGHNTVIIDELFGSRAIRGNVIPTVADGYPLSPDIIVLTGYNVAEEEILKEAKEYKMKYPSVRIIVGGVHIELNSDSFHKLYIDYVIHSHSLKVFENILHIIQGNELPIKGFDYNNKGKWTIGERIKSDTIDDIYPDREFFNKYKNQIYYLDKKNVALIKGSIGCPYKCSYCYCRELNEGKYLKADYGKMVYEMSVVEADYIWIVDDVLFTAGQDALSFIEEIERINLNKKFIAYLRSDFILREKEALSRLKKAGLDEVIIGFEAVNEEELKEYNKATNAIDYPEVIRILKEVNLDYTALFMVQPGYGIKDFKNLYSFIKENGIEVFTLSVFTPMKGTSGYDESIIIKKDPRYFDFLHLVTKSKLPKIIFYLLFYGMHIRMLKSKRIRNYLLRR